MGAGGRYDGSAEAGAVAVVAIAVGGLAVLVVGRRPRRLTAVHRRLWLRAAEHVPHIAVPHWQSGYRLFKEARTSLTQVIDNYDM